MHAPSSWLTANAHLLPARGRALDVACGGGRHAVWLAGASFDTLAVDKDAAAVDALDAYATGQGLRLRAEVLDLEVPEASLGDARYDVIVVVHYLHRALFPALTAALAEGGVLVYETFTREQALRGKPTNPDFLLEPGELRRLVAPLEVLAYREGEFEGRVVASVVARKATTR